MYLQPAAQEGDAPFNMASLFYIRLNEILAQKDKAAMSNDLVSYYYCLDAIYNNIFFKIENDDRTKKIRADLDKAFGLISIIPPKGVDSVSFSALAKNNSKEARMLLSDVDRVITQLMDGRKMIFPRMPGSFGIKGLRDKLGLKNE